MAENFLARWSQRKKAVQEGRELAPPVLAENQVQNGAAKLAPTEHAQTGSEALVQTGSATLALTLDDVAALTPDSDYSGFVAPQVAPEVRNAAMKKLFSDPHFNAMDGLDIYIDDYSVASALPAEMLKKMVSAQVLQLIDETESERPTTAAAGSLPAPTPLISATQEVHDHLDLRLQPHAGATARAPECGAE